MALIDILGFCLSLLGIYGLLLYLRHLLPRYAIPSLSTLLNETQQLLRHAEVISAISPENESQMQLYWYEDRCIHGLPSHHPLS